MGVAVVHASCGVVQGVAAFGGFDPVGGRRVTDAGVVKGAVAALL